ncbi:SusC/RagA family TonB-linked outer membrane protein [Pedobacter ginsenosidimutans]|uniref:SusC/RagA family TonB-linked outer membrane protein n=1 Tax=Pedobacter ginsenosidimutans TaxID=687842 RepID=A0A0T5VGU4_9SPHI|nr:TonB-dependent receptor [Pedobacter ginsenosidimutans]KRT13059.1 SusC/RagA family TonB-linked outer membrane protein [Pedobacter ginsenosidimutans]
MEMIPKSPEKWRRLLTLLTFSSILSATPFAKGVASTNTSLYNNLNINIANDAPNVANPKQTKTEVTVTGKVTDLTGKAIPGVVVKHKESGKATQTDSQGNYSLSTPDGKGTLVFSFIGFTSKEIVIGQQTRIDVQLADDNKKLDEVVIVGYGTQKKVNLTGSVSTVSSKDLDNRPITQASQALSGLSPGVQVQQGGGRPGSDGARVIIRGVGTFNAGSSPLILIDGIAGSLDDVAPDNIASMTVLKDAASAAIYGNRAANGVILVTTKRGQKGKTVISYNNYFGWEKITSLPQFVDSWTYAELTGASADVVAKYKSGADPDNFPNVSHLKDLLNTGSGFQQYHNASVSGGEGNNVYYLSGSYRDHNGLTAETNNKRYDIQANIDTRIKDNLNLKTSILGFSQLQTQPQSNSAGIGGIIGFSVREPNTIAGLKSDGTYGRQDFFAPEAWLASEGFNNLRAKNFYGNTTLAWDIIPGLNLSGTAGYHYYTSVNTTYVADINIDKTTYVGPNSLGIGNTDGNEVTLNLLLKYVKSFGKNNFSILGGYQQEAHRDNFTSAYRDKFPNNLLYQLDAGATTNMQNAGSANEYAFRSFFARFNYDYGGKYLFEANVRYDGSSRFAPKNRYGVFPAVSAGWRLSEESFIKDNISWINELKIRASYGSLGNANISNYPYQYNISTNVRYNFGGVIAPGAAVTAAANQDIKWETTTTANLGLDFTLFKNALSGTVDIYDRTAKDILYQVPVSSTLGLSAPTQNAGSIQNRGIEVSLTYNTKIGQVNFGVSPNFSYNNQKVIKIAGNIQNVIPNFFLGQPLNPIYGFVADGLFVDAADVASYPTQPNGGVPGNIRFKDISGPNGVPDGKVDATYDRQILGNTNPKASYGLNLTAAYKGFDFSALFSGLGGYTVQMGSYQAYALYNGGNVQQWQYENAWTTQNPDRNALYPRITNLSQGSANVQRNSYWNRSGTFLRLKNAQIGYTLPSNLTKKISLEKVRIFAGGQNLFTLNDFYEGWDPENGQGSGDNPNFYPLSAIYTFGINVKL